jgi:proteasome lid subunit RPN8/RPN11
VEEPFGRDTLSVIGAGRLGPYKTVVGAGHIGSNEAIVGAGRLRGFGVQGVSRLAGNRLTSDRVRIMLAGVARARSGGSADAVSEVRTYLRSRIMKWTEQQADVTPHPLTDALSGFAPFDVIAMLRALQQAPIVFFDPDCRARILEHVRSGETELGGLLLGWPYVDEVDGRLHPLVSIQWSVPSRVFRSTRVSLAMEADIWNHARRHIAAGAGPVVGWYHSHPNLGAFLSGTDRRTQRAVFNHPYSIGLVIDPVRDEEAWFRGPDSAPLHPRGCVIPLALPSANPVNAAVEGEAAWAGDIDGHSR